jgi:hypothetical protein
MSNTPYHISRKITRYKNGLFSNSGLFSAYHQKRCLRKLINLSKNNYGEAYSALAESFIEIEDPIIRQTIKNTLLNIQSQAGVNALWRVWITTRDANLLAVSISLQKHATQPPQLRLVSMLLFNRLDQLVDCAPVYLPHILACLADKNSNIAQNAGSLLLNLKNQDTINALCEIWFANRNQHLGRIIQMGHYVASHQPEIQVYTALLNRQLPTALGRNEANVAILIQAAEDPDPGISEQAIFCLKNLQKPFSIHKFCEIWDTSRSNVLTEILKHCRYTTLQPKKLYFQTILLAEKLTLAKQALPDDIPVLIDLLDDPEPEIHDNVKSVLGKLTNPQSQIALCLHAITHANQTALDIAVESDYQPDQPEDIASLLFLSRQWSKYKDFDFDHRLMQMVYQSANSDMRRTIAREIQNSGQSDLLPIISPTGIKFNLAPITDYESEVLSRILLQSEDWEKLWKLIPNLPVNLGLQALRKLSGLSWNPQNPSEKPFFDRLSKCANQLDLPINRHHYTDLPPIVSRAKLRIGGRVNDLCFAQESPQVLIGTSSKKLGIWDFQAGRLLKKYNSFFRSIGQAVFERDMIFCSEKTNGQNPCYVYGIKDDQVFIIGEHEGSITSLHALGNNQLLSTGRDHKTILWDVSAKTILRQVETLDWIRTAALHPGKKYLLTCETDLFSISLPELSAPKLIESPSQTTSSIGKKITFSPDGKHFIIGRHNGHCDRYRIDQGKLESENGFKAHEKSIIGIEFLKQHNLLFTAGAEGVINIYRWPSGELHRYIDLSDDRLTSLSIAPSGHFAATGSNAADFTLWDLRALYIPELFSLPLSQATPNHLAGLISALDSSQLTHNQRFLLQYIKLILERRFQFDIQISQPPMITTGEFDILLD